MANKFCKEVNSINKSIVRRCDYSCWKSGTHQSRKVKDKSLHRNCESTKTDCSWQANFYLGFTRVFYRHLLVILFKELVDIALLKIIILEVIQSIRLT